MAAQRLPGGGALILADCQGCLVMRVRVCFSQAVRFRGVFEQYRRAGTVVEGFGGIWTVSGGVGGEGFRALCGFGKVREYGFEKERFRDSRFCEPRSGLAVGVRLSSSRCTPW